jgi:hypothetical protein
LNGVECVDGLSSRFVETGTVEGLDVAGCLASISRPAFLLEIPNEEEVEMSREELERFAGTYTFEGGGLQVTLELTDEGLMASFDEESERLVPIGPLRFKPFGEPPGGYWQFIEENGAIVSLRVMSGETVQIELLRE